MIDDTATVRTSGANPDRYGERPVQLG